MKQLIARASIPLAALLSIGVGAGWMWGGGAALLAVGGLVWLDLWRKP